MTERTDKQVQAPATGRGSKRQGRFRVLLHQPWCKGCYVCLEFCPRGVFDREERMGERGFQPVRAARPEACDGCLQCEFLCPDLAISVEELGRGEAGPSGWSPAAGKAPVVLAAGETSGAVRLSPSTLPPGLHYLQGDEACAEGALAAGCRFYAGYPITPASETMHRIVERFRECGGVFVQMEDEIGSIGAMIGASWTGARAMTATSGPGLSLMMENVGYAAMTETPIVILDVQRAGPCTGQATRPGAGDIYQVKYGSHGDYEVIALCPWSAQEMYDMTIEAFNLADRYRVPVFLLADEGVGHLRENVRVRPEVEIWERPRAPRGTAPFDTAGPAGIPPMPLFGEGENLLVTGSTHDGLGYRKTAVAAVHRRLVTRLTDKIRSREEELTRLEEYLLEDAEVALVACGFTARAALRAIRELRAAGVRAGLLRLRAVWPFPDRALGQRLERARWIVVPELNRGQVCREVARVAGRERVHSLPQTDGEVMKPGAIVRFVEELIR